MKHHRFFAVALLCLLLVLRVGAAPPDEAAVVAWVRGGDEEFNGTKYHFLAQKEWRVSFAVPPQKGAALELLWGSKNDARGAVLTVNGQTIPLASGGDYNGFAWLRVPLPEVAGERYEIALKAGAGKAAFVAEVRLCVPGGDARRPDLKTQSYKATATLVGSAAGRGEAFPEMRVIWDTPAHGEPPEATGPDEYDFRRAEANARQANEALYRARRFIDGWLAHADPATGLIPRNLNESRDFWNGRDAAADNYPFMVLTAALTDRPLLEGRLREMLRTETRLTSRIDRLPDDYSFSKKGWRREKVDLDAMIFDGAEYVKDGLLPITEWLGPSAWSERAIGIVEDIWKNAAIETRFGKIPTKNFEVNGDLLQACSRLYWFTGDRKYLEWAQRLGDYYLLGDQHPTRDLKTLNLGDHSCEVINGLAELYVACAYAAPEKREAYRAPLHALYDRILEIGRNEHGLLYLQVDTRTGAHSAALTDNWGYNYDGLYTAWLLDKKTSYRDAVTTTLANLKPHYTGHVWQGGSADGYADSLEGAITLLNRENVPTAAEWIDSEIKTMWAKQRPDGVIEGWHGDGNSARTSLMYALWKTQGLSVQPWRADVRFGAVQKDGVLYVSLLADKPWQGQVFFDKPRHQMHMKLPLDYPRINQFPEWFTAHSQARYAVQWRSQVGTKIHSGRELQAGLPITLEAGREVRCVVQRMAQTQN